MTDNATPRGGEVEKLREALVSIATRQRELFSGATDHSLWCQQTARAALASPPPVDADTPAASEDAFRRGAEAMQRSLADALRDHLNSRAAAIANSLPIPEYQP